MRHLSCLPTLLVKNNSIAKPEWEILPVDYLLDCKDLV